MVLKKCFSLEDIESRANFRLEHSVQKNSCPTVEFDTSVVLHYLFRCSVSPGNFPLKRSKKSWAIYFAPPPPPPPPPKCSAKCLNGEQPKCRLPLWDCFWGQILTPVVIRYFYIPKIYLVYPQKVLYQHCFQLCLIPRFFSQ